MKKKLIGLMIGLVVVAALAFTAFHQHTATHAAAAADCSAGTSWQVDEDDPFDYPTYSGIRETAHYSYEIALSTLRDASGNYCGQASGKFCIWTHTDNGFADAMDLHLTHYLNGTEDGGDARLFYQPKPFTEDGPFCTYTGSFNAASGTSITLLGQANELGSPLTQSPTLTRTVY